MRALPTTAQITATYSDGCFCQRREFPSGATFSTDPRFLFRKEAEKYAAENGLQITVWHKYKAALAISKEPCQHRDKQAIRLSWQLART